MSMIHKDKLTEAVEYMEAEFCKYQEQVEEMDLICDKYADQLLFHKEVMSQALLLAELGDCDAIVKLLESAGLNLKRER